jgi:type II secretory pathway pseudopilin PulG
MKVEQLNRIKRGFTAKSRKLNQRGDTLIEVTFALVILAAVLVSSSMLAVKALQQAHTGQERTQVADEAQRQLEGLRSFRDNHTWNEFLNGSGGTYLGVLNVGGTTCKAGAAPCFHLDTRPTTPGVTSEFVPLPNSMSGKVATSYIEVRAVQDGNSPPQSVDVTVSYGFLNEGGGPNNVGHIKARFTNLDFGLAASPTPQAFTPTPTPVGCAGGPKDIVLMLDWSHSMSNDFIKNSGVSRASIVRANTDLAIDNLSISSSQNQAALYAFARVPQLLSGGGFKNSPGSLHSALTAYDWKNLFGTFFTPALNQVGVQFGSARPGAQKALIFLTDGDLTDTFDPGIPGPYDSSTAARAAATALKNSGITIYTIGLNLDNVADPNARANLTAIGSPGKFYDAVSPGQFAAMLDSIATELSC